MMMVESDYVCKKSERYKINISSIDLWHLAHISLYKEVFIV